MKALILVALMASFTVSAVQADDDLDPFAPNIDEKLRELDEYYKDTAMPQFDWMAPPASCYQFSCKVYIDIQKSTQTATLYVDGQVHLTDIKVSTGLAGHNTPNFDRHPENRVYDRYSSSKYPGGDYNGLGNMPYAVFIKGGFALHGTPKGNWKKLGTKASHGCIRMHPDNAKIFNRLVRENGVANTWVTVRE